VDSKAEYDQLNVYLYTVIVTGNCVSSIERVMADNSEWLLKIISAVCSKSRVANIWKIQHLSRTELIKTTGRYV